ncbi:hypothetical protein WQ54_07970 [Bacillus sp. SA1-12]|uniref:hypothetical protein n=1 Tax=Bacillus sp. SA1-12 TaxID=1455638 RepID=UPI0006255C18|nr:hypothetical protein [Bacillus sp. SA1-12]KKI92800.1 hypothetical protein WQ54_07970 [Bacillus sp. SA1-12]
MEVKNVQMFVLGRNLVTTFTVHHDQSPASVDVECMFSSTKIEDLKISIRNHHKIDTKMKSYLYQQAEQEAEKIFKQNSIQISEQLNI